MRLLLALSLALLAGCLPHPKCDLGTFLSKADTDESESLGASATVTPVAGSGKANWRGTGSSDWACARICRPGELLRASLNERGAIKIECLQPVPVSSSAVAPPSRP